LHFCHTQATLSIDVSIAHLLRKGAYKDRNGKMIQGGLGNYPELHLAASEIDAVFIRKLIEQANNIQK
ncbi:MAG: hypothetical protein RDU59_12540, partial [Thermodesulfobacteriota bacterium]|nr:hypothetical protein [Thermodesulfobacteriota bacterium]